MIKKITDPFSEREAEKYSRPVPSREYLLTLLQKIARPVSRNGIFEALHAIDPHDQKALSRRLRAMERDGQLYRNRRGEYGLVESMQLIAGVVQGHREGFGFLIPDEGGADLYLGAKAMRQLFEGDKILVRLAGLDRRGRPEGQLVDVLKRNTTTVVGRYFQENNMGVVVPENKRISHDIWIPEPSHGVNNGEIVEVKIISYPTAHKQAVGEIISILGEHMAPGMEIDVAIRMYELPHQWPDTIMKEAQKIKETISKAEIAKRVDLREHAFVTIDGEDAKDFDDAVYCEPRRGGSWRLYVAIADVSHYVKPKTEIDAEAYLRGNSVYFPGRVLPMLPEVLSNGVCSLKPNCDRLVMVAQMSINSAGKMTRYQFYPAVIHSHARLTYTEVAAALEQGQVAPAIASLLPALNNLLALYQILHAARLLRGAIDFDTVETRIIFGPDKKIQEVRPTVRNVAHRIIEECMLCANVATARFLMKAKIPTLYRIHDGPPADKLADLKDFLKARSLAFPRKAKIEPMDYAKLLDKAKTRSDLRLIQMVLLRSLSQACYSPENIGHFGLAYTEYTHFTSPIRRYPDLLVHRQIKQILSESKKGLSQYTFEAINELGNHCSLTDRRAEQATRDVVQWLKCEFMLDKVGKKFDGLITGVTGFGFFVELQQIFVEGLVHVATLKNDYYRFDPIKHTLKGEASGQTYCLGDTVKVAVARVDLDERKIDFELVQHQVEQRSRKRKRRK